MVPPGSEIDLDEATAESLIRAHLAEMVEEVEPPPKIETPKKRYS